MHVRAPFEEAYSPKIVAGGWAIRKGIQELICRIQSVTAGRREVVRESSIRVQRRVFKSSPTRTRSGSRRTDRDRNNGPHCAEGPPMAGSLTLEAWGLRTEDWGRDSGNRPAQVDFVIVLAALARLKIGVFAKVILAIDQDPATPIP